MRLFRVLALVLGLAPLFAAEIVLRLFAPSPHPLEHDPIFETASVSPLFQPSDQHFEIATSRLNFFRPDRFLRAKSHQGRRIFVLGGSTVQGRPYETETAFSSWLRLRLQAADPTHEYEVVNCGGVSYASYRLAIVLREVLEYQPDAVVLYTGHNEFLEDRSYQTLRPRRPIVDAIVGRSRLLQTLSRTLQHPPAQRLSSEVRTRLDEPDGMQRYVRDQAWRRAVVDHFERNVRRMVSACAAAEVPLVICRPVSEIIETAPFKVATGPLDAAVEESFKANWRITQDADAETGARMEACDKCLQADPEHAGAHFVAGHLHLVAEHTETAIEHLVAARDNDVCPLRATSDVLRSLELVAEETGTPLIDLRPLFDQDNLAGQRLPDGLPDRSKFVDHIHPTIAMHQAIAAALSKHFVERWDVQSGRNYEAKYNAAAQSHLSTLDETYFARGKQRLEGLLNWAAGRAGELHVGESPIISSQPE